MGGVDQLGGVLQHQNRIVLLDAVAGGVAMGGADMIGGHARGGEKAIGGFGGSPRATGLRNADGRSGELISHDADEALGQARIAQTGGRQLQSGPGLMIW